MRHEQEVAVSLHQDNSICKKGGVVVLEANELKLVSRGHIREVNMQSDGKWLGCDCSVDFLSKLDKGTRGSGAKK